MAIVTGGKHFGQYTYEHWFDNDYREHSPSDLRDRLAALGIGIPDILLPRNGIDLSKWAVVACDQFTQDRDYWAKAEQTVGAAESSLRMIFPEVYLNDEGDVKTQRIQKIRASMNSYLQDSVFAPPRRCCVYLERSTSLHPKRRGLVLLIDLERYDWAPESRPLIRSTEGTVKERLPSRIEIRSGAPLELPHILILMDDEEDRILPALGEIARKNSPLYETPLMMNSGSVTGWALDTEAALTTLAEELENLVRRAFSRYGMPAESAPEAKSRDSLKEEWPFLFAVGDGNHSLATAKAVWEQYKKENAGEADLEHHPARWAMVELENLYDPGISFEPIHRVVFGTEPAELMDYLSVLKDKKCRLDPSNERIIRIENLSPSIATAGIQPLLDEYVKQKNRSIDYIHGENELLRLVSDPKRRPVGLIFPPVQKEGLFKTVAQTGPLPRKSFSMGEAEEKRFYLECRRLFI